MDHCPGYALSDSGAQTQIINDEPSERIIKHRNKETAEAEIQPKDSESTKKPPHKGKEKKGAASTEDADK